MSKLDIQRFRGDTDPILLTISKGGAVLDLTGSEFILSVSESSSPTTPSYVFQLNGVVTPLEGKVTFTPTADQVDIVGNYFHDIQMTKGVVIKTVATGKFKMIQDITK